MNADSQINVQQGILGDNLFTYCLNNPVNMVDYSGFASAAVPAAVAGGIAAEEVIAGLLALIASWFVVTTVEYNTDISLTKKSTIDFIIQEKLVKQIKSNIPSKLKLSDGRINLKNSTTQMVLKCLRVGVEY